IAENVHTASSQSLPVVTALADGGVAVAWSDNDEINPAPFSVLGDLDNVGGGGRARLFNSDGSGGGNDFAVNQIQFGLEVRPDLTTLSDGRIAVTWSSNFNGQNIPDTQDGQDEPSNGFEVEYRIFSASGTALTQDLRANTSFAFDQ